LKANETINFLNKKSHKKNGAKSLRFDDDVLLD